MENFKTQSETIGKIATALAAFQSQAKGVKKTAENPFFHSKYAELADVWDEIREPLAKNGLAVIQTFLGDSLVTTLAHTSGEWFSGYLKLAPTKQNDPQAQGSSITYTRRYALQAIVGIAPIDDDGNAASQPQTTRKPVLASVDGDTVKQTHSALADVGNLVTSRFEVSEPIASKNRPGRFFRKAIDADGNQYYIHHDSVIADLSVANGQEVTVRIERSGKFTNIEEVLVDTSKAIPF